jgi:diguanylate cyclase
MNSACFSDNTGRTIRISNRVTYSIAAFFLLLGLAVGAATYRLVSADYETVRTNALHNAGLLADSYALHLRQSIKDTDVLARFIAFESQGSHPQSLKEMVAEQVIEPGDVTLVTIADLKGEPTDSWPTSLPSPLVLTDRAHFVAHESNPNAGLFIAAPVIGGISGQWTLEHSRRINHPDGSFAGVVVISKSPGYLSAGFISSADVGTHGIGAVFRSDGALLSRTDAAGVTSADGPALVSYDPQSRDGAWEGRDPVTNEPRIYARRAVPDFPLIAVVGLSGTDVYSHRIAREHVYLAIGALILVVLLIAAIPAILYARNVVSRHAITRDLAETDDLTGLGNSHKLAAFLRAFIDGLPTEPVALVAIDLHRFGQVNETMGHDVGDALLRQAADRIRRAAGPASVRVRTGGDKFVIGLHGTDASPLAITVARALIDQFAAAFGLRGRTYPLRISVGIASTEMGTRDAATLRANATAAMDVAKKSTRRSGHSEYAVYSQCMADNATLELGTMDGLVTALNNGGLSIRSMPVVLHGSRKQTGVMSELYWNKPEAGFVHESSFMTIARRKGLAYALQSHTLQEAGRALALDERARQQNLALHVRISAALLADSNAIPDMASLQLSPDRMRLILYDITPDQLSDATRSKIFELRQQGAAVFLQIDTGGECSLDLLEKLAFDGLFLSPSLFQHVPANRRANAIVHGLITMCRDLGLRILVGGIDSKEHYEWLPATPGLECFGSYLSSALQGSDVDIVCG